MKCCRGVIEIDGEPYMIYPYENSHKEMVGLLNEF